MRMCNKNDRKLSRQQELSSNAMLRQLFLWDIDGANAQPVTQSVGPDWDISSKLKVFSERKHSAQTISVNLLSFSV